MLRSEDLFADPQGALDRVTGFLAVERFRFPDLSPTNAHEYPALDSAAQRQLAASFAASNERVAALTGIGWG